MSKTIEQLTTQIEELEKRIKIISSSQSSLSQIMAIRDCIDQIKTYLEDLNTTLDNIESSASDAELEALKARVSICEEDISTLQTDLATTQDDISNLQSSLNATNTTVGQHSTTITNLQTTQTNLQTTQSSQASTINNINSRLTTCENNVSTLTGGVDVGEIDSRITALENGGVESFSCHRQYDFHNIAPTDNKLYMRQIGYSCEKDVEVSQNFKLSYSSQSTGTMTIEIYEDITTLVQTETVDLAQYPSEYIFARQFYSSKMSNNFTVKIESTETITYKTLDVWILAKNAMIYEFDREVKASCYDGYTYITRYYPTCVKAGKFAPEDEIDLDNLPISINYQNENGCFISALFGRYCQTHTGNGVVKNDYDNCFMMYDNKHNFVIVQYDQTTQSFSVVRTEPNSVHLGEYYSGIYVYVCTPTIVDSKPCATPNDNKSALQIFEYTNIGNNYGEVLDLKLAYYKNALRSDNTKTLAWSRLAMLAEDGYVYFINTYYTPQASKLCKKGISFVLYDNTPENNNPIIYINFPNKVVSYNILYVDKKYVLGNEEIYEGCSYIYEILGNKIIKKTPTGWVVDNIQEETTTTQETT